MVSKKQYRNTDLITLLIEKEKLKDKPKLSQEKIREKAKQIYPEIFNGVLSKKIKESFMKGA